MTDSPVFGFQAPVTFRGAPFKAAPAGVKFLNPDFDRRMQVIGGELNRDGTSHSPNSFDNRSIRKGMVVMNQPLDLGDCSTKYRPAVRFLFNPQGLTVQTPLGMNAPTDSNMSSEDKAAGDGHQQGSLLGFKYGSTTVSVYYDRTYEINDSSRLPSDPAKALGCYADAAAWYQMLNMTTSDIVNTFVDGHVEAAHEYSSSITKPLIQQQATLIIGPGLVFTGFITNLSVNYSHFTRGMIPIRCTVNFEFAFMSDDVDNSALVKDFPVVTSQSFLRPPPLPGSAPSSTLQSTLQLIDPSYSYSAPVDPGGIGPLDPSLYGKPITFDAPSGQGQLGPFGPNPNSGTRGVF